MRDIDRLKEKHELSLDNRQIFFLFFGSALVACLVFVVGVMVGKRLEARKATRQPKAADDLALMDQQSGQAKPLTFHDVLIKPDAHSGRGVPAEVLEWRNMGGKAAGSRAAVVAEADSPASPDQARRDHVSGAEPRRAEPSRAGNGSAARKAAERKRRYTLQVSAFQKRADARQMMEKLQSQGYRPYVVTSNIPNRGVWYRVRLGSFGSWKEATRAKKKFEDKLNVTAYVSRR